MAGTGQAPPHERNYGTSLSAPACDDALHGTSCGTRTPSSSRGEGVPLIVIQRQLGHSNLGITSIYLQGIDNAEIIDTVHARKQPMVPVSASLSG